MDQPVAQKSEVIFEMTRDHLETGLRGVPVGYCTTSSVDPLKGLFYNEVPIENLAYQDPEKVIYFLYHGKEANPAELQKFKEELWKRSRCSPELLERIRMLPRDGHPMQLFCAAILLCGMLEGEKDYQQDCLSVLAKMPEIVATVINHHAGWSQNPSRPELGYIENFTQMLGAPGIDLKKMTHIMRLFNVLHYDHGGGNLSTFVGKAVASGLEDMYGSLSASMAALAGPRHGGANQDCLRFVKDVLSQVGEKATGQDVEALIRSRLKNNQLVFGFGHAVLRVEDPRATILFKAAHELYPEHPLVKIASLLRQEGSKVLKENPKISNPYPNVDAISGTLLAAGGFDYPEYFTVLFGMSRCVGIAIQIVYERCEARGGKGTPIIRPKYYYKSRFS